jgi:hypothetical protein
LFKDPSLQAFRQYISLLTPVSLFLSIWAVHTMFPSKPGKAVREKQYPAWFLEQLSLA